MPLENNATLQDVIQAQNEFIAEQSQKIATLETNTATALQNLSALGNRVYSYNHEDFAVDDIEAVYNAIIAADNAKETPEGLAGKSAVGFTAILKTGDSIYTQGNICYINGVLCESLTSDGEAGYTFTGLNGCEYVTVWYFESDGTLAANRINTNVSEIVVKVKQTTPAFSVDFFDYADSVTSNVKFTNSFTYFGTKKMKSTVGGTATIDSSGTNDFVPDTLYEYESYYESLPGCSYGIRAKTNVKKIVFPFLKTITDYTSTGGSPGSFYNVKAEIEFKMLETIESSPYASRAPFLNTDTVIVPASVKTIGANIFNNNRNIVLNCNEAETIDDAWIANAPTNLFSMCSDWAASINIAIAAANWTKSDFVDLFTYNLRDMGDDVRELKIPSAIYDELTDEEFEIAENKGWTIGC